MHIGFAHDMPGDSDIRPCQVDEHLVLLERNERGKLRSVLLLGMGVLGASLSIVIHDEMAGFKSCRLAPQTPVTQVMETDS